MRAAPLGAHVPHARSAACRVPADQSREPDLHHCLGAVRRGPLRLDRNRGRSFARHVRRAGCPGAGFRPRAGHTLARRTRDAAAGYRLRSDRDAHPRLRAGELDCVPGDAAARVRRDHLPRCDRCKRTPSNPTPGPLARRHRQLRWAGGDLGPLAFSWIYTWVAVRLGRMVWLVGVAIYAVRAGRLAVAEKRPPPAMKRSAGTVSLSFGVPAWRCAIKLPRHLCVLCGEFLADAGAPPADEPRPQAASPRRSPTALNPASIWPPARRSSAGVAGAPSAARSRTRAAAAGPRRRASGAIRRAATTASTPSPPTPPAPAHTPHLRARRIRHPVAPPGAIQSGRRGARPVAVARRVVSTCARASGSGSSRCGAWREEVTHTSGPRHNSSVGQFFG